MTSSRRTGWAWLVATFFGAGWLRPGPGSWGSAAAVLVWAVFAGLAARLAGGEAPPGTMAVFLLAAASAAVALGVPAATRVAREAGGKDPGFVVIDEAAGQWLALLGSPVDLRHALAAFLLFRLFDITKPFPVRRLERLPEGWGIVADDLGAGLYALLAGLLLRRWI